MLRFEIEYLEQAKKLAEQYNNEFVTAEHVVYTIVEDEQFNKFFLALNIDSNVLKQDLENYFEETSDKTFKGNVTFSECLVEVLYNFDQFYSKYGYGTVVEFVYMLYKYGGDYLKNAIGSHNAEEALEALNNDINSLLTSGRFDKLPDYIGLNIERANKPVEFRHMETNRDTKDLIRVVMPPFVTCPKYPYLLDRPAYTNKIRRMLKKTDRHHVCLYGDDGVGKSSLIDKVVCDLAENPEVIVLEIDFASFDEMSTTVYKDILKRFDEVEEERGLEDCARVVHVRNMNLAVKSFSVVKIINAFIKLDDSVSFIFDLKEQLVDTLSNLDPFGKLVNYIKVTEASQEEQEEWIRSGAEYIVDSLTDLSLSDDAVDKAIELIKNSNPFERLCYVESVLALIEHAVIRRDEEAACGDHKIEFAKGVNTDSIDEAYQDLCTDESKKGSLTFEKVQSLKENLQTEIFGQDEALNEIVMQVENSLAGLNAPNKPIASFMFVGSTGTGKTQTARSLAKFLGMNFIKYDMSEFSEQHSTAKLIGAPPGYVGYDEGGSLVESIRKNPSSVVLFDEIEKAHQTVYDLLLQIMDDAVITNGKKEKADFSKCIIILTSNAGAADMKRNGIGFGNDKANNDAMSKAVKETFKPEFRARLSAVLEFNDLGDIVFNKIINRELNVIVDRLKAKKINLTFDDELVNFICKEVDIESNGARGIQNYIERKITPLLSHAIINSEIKAQDKIKLFIENNSIKFKKIL